MTPPHDSQKAAKDEHVRFFVRKTGTPLKILSEAMDLKKSEVLNWWTNSDKKLSQKNVESLAKFFGISLSTLANPSEETDFVRRRIHQGPQILPKKFSENACSHVRTSAHIIEYLSLLYGRHFTDHLLSELDIHPCFFDDLNNKINLNFFIELFSALSEQGISDQEIASCASHIFLRIRDSKFGDSLRGTRDHYEFYQLLAQNAQMMETNFDYKIEKRGSILSVRAKPTEANIFFEKRSTDELRRLFLYRQNVFNWFPSLGGLTPLSMKVTKCISRGDSETVYEAEMPSLAVDLHVL